jgi:outer membrane protein assembly factor BamD
MPNHRPMSSGHILSRAGLRTASMALALIVTIGVTGCASGPKDDPNSQASLDKLYSEAKDDLSVGSYEAAIKKLERIEGRAAGTLLAQQAMLELAWAQFRSGEKAPAIATLDRFIKLHPSSPGFDYALYLKGLVNFNEDTGLFGRLAGQDISERDQQASREALAAFRDLVARFPQSRYADDALVRIDFITNMLARHEVHVARYYYERGAYLAAINRAQTAISEYQYAPATEEALSLMVKSYGALKMPELEADARRVLQKNFPNSALLAGSNSTKPWWKLW